MSIQLWYFCSIMSSRVVYVNKNMLKIWHSKNKCSSIKSVYENHIKSVYKLIKHSLYENRCPTSLSRHIFEVRMYFLILIYSIEEREILINTYVKNIRFLVWIYNYKYLIVLDSCSLVLGDFEYSFYLTSRTISLDYTSGQAASNLLWNKWNLSTHVQSNE